MALTADSPPVEIANALGIPPGAVLGMAREEIEARLADLTITAEEMRLAAQEQPTEEVVQLPPPDVEILRDVYQPKLTLYMANEQREFAHELAVVAEDVINMLLDKNRKYGDSALSPINAVSKLPPEEGIKIRIDDKIKRMISGQADDEELPLKDLVGYYFLLEVLLARR